MVELKQLVRESIDKRKKPWVEGVDTVQYAGSYFDENEYEAAIKCLLDGWLPLS